MTSKAKKPLTQATHVRGSDKLTALLGRLKAGDPRAANAFLEGCQVRLRALAAKIFRDFPRLRGLEEPADVLQEAEIRLLRRLEKFAPDTVEDFFRLAAWEIRCVLRNLVCHHFGPGGAARQQFTGGGAKWESRREPRVRHGYQRQSARSLFVDRAA